MAKELPKNLNRKAVEQLIEACIGFYPAAILGQGSTGYQRSEVEVPELKQKWTDRLKFSGYILDLTGTDDIKRASDVLASWKNSLSPESEQTEKEQEKEEQPASTTPTNEQLEQLKAEAEERERQKNKADENAKAATRQRIQALEKRARLDQERRAKIQQAQAAKTATLEKETLKIYLKPQTPVVPVELNPEETTALKSFADSAKANPEEFVKILSSKIVEQAQTFSPELTTSMGPEQLQQTATQVALEVAQRLLTEKPTFLSPWVLTPFANPEDEKIKKLIPDEAKRKELAEAAQELALIFDNDEKISRQLLYPVFGEKVTSRLYGADTPITYIPSEKEEEGSHYEIDPERIIDTYKKTKPIIEKLYKAFQTKDATYVYEASQEAVNSLVANSNWYQASRGLVSRISTSTLFKAGLTTTGAVVGYKAGTAVSSYLVTHGVRMIGGAGSVAGLLGSGAAPSAAPIISILIDKQIGGFALKIASIRAGGQLALGFGVKAGGFATRGLITGFLAEAGAALGSAAPIVGTAIGLVIGWVAGKVIEALPKIKRFFVKNAPVMGAVVVGVVLLLPVTIFTPFLLVGAAIFAVGGLIVGAGGVGGAGAAAAGFVTTAFGAFINITLLSLAKFLVIFFFSVVTFVALAMFIINSGAYIVPTSTNFTQNLGQSEFITVTKESDVSSLTNSQLPKTVTYKITVSAPKGSLSNITFKNECNVIKDTGSPPCVHPTPTETPPTIDSNTPFVFSYSQTYDSAFTDSLISDSFTVTADSPDEKGSTSVASASVIVGTPPTKCFDVAGSNWPSNFKANVLTAVATLNSSFVSYSAKVCSHGTLRIVYDTSKNPGGWGYYSGGTIYLNGGGLGSQIDTLYILSHESGHHLGFLAAPNLYIQYLDTPGVTAELPLCSYANTTNSSEGFAESIALYITRDQSSQWKNRCSGTFQSKYPKHWTFDIGVIFK